MGLIRHGRRVVLAALLTMGLPEAGRGQTEGPVPEEAGFSATVQVARAIVDDDGAIVRALPGARYRVAQFAGGRLRLTMLATADRAADALDERYAGITVEGNPATGALDVRDRQGRSLALHDAAAAPWAGPVATTEPLVATPGTEQARRSRIEHEFGARVGQVRGLDRYLARQDGGARELLVAPDTALPVEVNVVTGHTLVEHHTFEYQRLPGGGWIRHRTTSAAAIPGQPSQRLVAVSTLDDIRTTGGAR